MGEDLLHRSRDVGGDETKKRGGRGKKKKEKKKSPKAGDRYPSLSPRDINFPRLYTVQVFLAWAHEIVCRHRPMEILF